MTLSGKGANGPPFSWASSRGIVGPVTGAASEGTALSYEKRGKGPRAVAAMLDGVVKPAFASHGFWEAAVLTNWAAIVGPALAAHSCPEKFGRDGSLTVRVAGGHALEMQHLEPVVLDRIATYFGYRAVNRLILRQGPLPKREKRRSAIPAPLDEEQKRLLGDTVAPIDRSDLKAALESLGRAALGRRR